jgi:hypothetical protein
LSSPRDEHEGQADKSCHQWRRKRAIGKLRTPQRVTQRRVELAFHRRRRPAMESGNFRRGEHGDECR